MVMDVEVTYQLRNIMCSASTAVTEGWEGPIQLRLPSDNPHHHQAACYTSGNQSIPPCHTQGHLDAHISPLWAGLSPHVCDMGRWVCRFHHKQLHWGCTHHKDTRGCVHSHCSLAPHIQHTYSDYHARQCASCKLNHACQPNSGSAGLQTPSPCISRYLHTE